MYIIKKILVLYIVLCTISLVIAVPTIRSLEKRTPINTNILSPLPPPATTSSVHVYDFILNQTTLSPDGVPRLVWTVNGQYPGPMVVANVGDQIILNVTNLLGEPSSIHSHGIVQRNTNWYDGVPGITQCPIPNGVNFIYNYTVVDAGTYWYHSHFMAQYVDGLLGPMIVQDPADPHASLYDFEYVVTLNEWYHNTTKDILAVKMAPTYQGVNPVPDAVLISGYGQYDCTAASTKNKTCTSVTPATYVVQSGKRYRFRIINTSADSHFHFSIDNHQLSLIEVDGTNVTQACQFRVNASTINYDSSINWNATGILRYEGANGTTPTSQDFPDTAPLTCDDVPDSSLIPFVANPPPQNATQYILNITYAPNSQGLGIFFINGNSFEPHFNNATLMQVTSGGVSPQSLPANQNIISYDTANAGIELVFVNNIHDIHPFHLVYILIYLFIIVYSISNSNGTTPDPSTYNLVNPPYRDTVTIPQNGWLAIRFVADNPGIWAVHCHIEWHVEMGMVVTLVERLNDLKQLTIPDSVKKLCQAS
ncbi:2475_t:CDS:2 [Cetraspora pellucida]|uniref:2475_t:CDS:1 n=1 Tax=Cetraspora pellucida TaxID=1433469 RepID=A0ACA9L0Q8_9GLOM|nr:2475_t:CDS:2 [Cetraspora pellucida]